MMTYRAADPSLNKNDASLAVYLQDGTDGMLLTGDLETEGVGQLLASGLPGPVSLLKLPHHGSRYSGSERLIEQLSPRYCLVSAGYRNRYRLPATQLVDYVAENGIPLFRTDQQGTIRALLAEDGWKLSHWQDGLFR